jgi:hypothetical protein
LEAIRVIKKRAIEETRRRDLREVENEVTDGYARTRKVGCGLKIPYGRFCIGK